MFNQLAFSQCFNFKSTKYELAAGETHLLPPVYIPLPFQVKKPGWFALILSDNAYFADM